MQTPHFWEIMGYVEDEIQALKSLPIASDSLYSLCYSLYLYRRACRMALGSLASSRSVWMGAQTL